MRLEELVKRLEHEIREAKEALDAHLGDCKFQSECDQCTELATRGDVLREVLSMLGEDGK